MRDTDLRRAAVFHAVAAAGGIAAASPRLGKSAPAIHHDLKRFEAEIGRPLFERAGRALRLTVAGQALFESVGRALDEVQRTRMRLAQEDPALRPLRVATVSAFSCAATATSTACWAKLAGSWPAMRRFSSAACSGKACW